MMDEITDGSDTSSIKPLSSLRSKFENLSKQTEPVAPSPRTPRPISPFVLAGSPSLKPSDQLSSDSIPVGASDEELPRPGFRSNGYGAARSRPVSMILLNGSPRPLPLLTVESPRSPHKTFSVDLRPTNTGQSFRSTTSENGMSASVNTQVRPLTKAITPALEARTSFLKDSAKSAPSSPVISPIPVSAPRDAQEQVKPSPPAVNRAAKPKIPIKPPALAPKSTALIPPEVSADLSDHSTSPFGTPPSSAETSPERKLDAQPPPLSLKDTQSRPSAVQRPRNDSEVSWVQRIRGFSDASSADRSRTGSNASFVEESDFPESWLPHQAHHPVTARRDVHANLPARYRSVPDHSVEDKDESPERSRVPARPELQARHGRRSPRTSPVRPRSGRSSPIKNELWSSSSHAGQTPLSPRPPSPTKPTALSMGFDRPQNVRVAPELPASRRSVERRRQPPPPPPPSAQRSHAAQSQEQLSYLTAQEQAQPSAEAATSSVSDFPDATRSNRRPPKFKQRPWQIPTEYDTRLFAVCGEYVCTTGYITKAWNMRTGELLMSLEHRDVARVQSIVFKPSTNIEDEGKRIWLGTNAGEIHEVDIPSQRIVKTKSNAHSRREVVRMFRYASQLWTLDDAGDLHVWKPDHKGMPSLDSPTVSWRTSKNHAFAMACGSQLWMAHGKDVRAFAPGARNDAEFYLTKTPLQQPGTGDVTTGATLDSDPTHVYFGHTDGKVSIYNRNDFFCSAVVTASLYRIISLTGVGDYLWAGYSTGMAYVYDTSTTPWTVRKDWQAHDKQICSIVADPSAMWKMGRLNVVTLGLDNMLKIWDGMLEEDWLSAQMDRRDSDYCSFKELTASVLTWNAGASKPTHLLHNRQDDNFFRDFISSQEPADIFVFGFQEVVDLEDKKVISKSLFRSKKKDPAEQEHTSHVYRAWRDHLARCLAEHIPGRQPYTLLHTASMVGLFTCVFVKATERHRIRHVHTSEVKRGMGGSLGNKGAILIRLIVDDSSLCFINCHLAAGQTQTINRNNDAAAILEAKALPAYPLHGAEAALHTDIFSSGGDGSMVLDHEICILNGDLNYRIDTMGRDTVVKHVQQGNLTRLLERDQLLLSRKRNPGFRLRAFQESPITFAPTYKYNVNSDEYDTSEKRRAPAWCDRIMYRGLGKVKMEEYRRWDQIRVSDHRPVSGRLRMRVKTVDAQRRAATWEKCLTEVDGVQKRIIGAAQLSYLTNVLGMSSQEATQALRR